MKKYCFRISLVCAVLLFSGCQLFQTINTPVTTTTPNAQEHLSRAFENLYAAKSGTFLHNYILTLYKSGQPQDRWTINLRDNWRTEPLQSLADLHISFTLPPPSSNGEIAQGLINMSTARNNSQRYIQLNNANFSGSDGHVLDNVLGQWTGEWFILPPDAVEKTGFTWLLNLPQLLAALPRESVIKTNYFRILDARSVQMETEQGTLFTVALNTGAVNDLLLSAPSTIATETIAAMNKFLDASEFNGTLLVGNDTNQLYKVDGTLTIQSANDTAQKLSLVTNIELSNMNQNPPVAVPIQALPLPSELTDPDSVLQ